MKEKHFVKSNVYNPTLWNGNPFNAFNCQGFCYFVICYFINTLAIPRKIRFTWQGLRASANSRPLSSDRFYVFQHLSCSLCGGLPPHRQIYERGYQAVAIVSFWLQTSKRVCRYEFEVSDWHNVNQALAIIAFVRLGCSITVSSLKNLFLCTPRYHKIIHR